MARPDIKGNPWVLAGSIMYLLEWCVIIPAGNTGPASPGSSRSQILSLYDGHPAAVMLLSTWCSLVLIGRVLTAAGIRQALGSVGARSAWSDLAVAAMALSVGTELLSVVAVSAARLLAHDGAAPDSILALDAVAGFAFACTVVLIGMSVAVMSLNMLSSKAFPIWLPSVGLVGAGLLMFGGVLSGPAYAGAGVARSLSNVAQPAVPLFWLWMLATGIFLIRRPRTNNAASVSTRAAAPKEGVLNLSH